MRSIAPGILTLPDGRRLAWCERGDPCGAPIFAFHGLPGSRLQAHPDERIDRNARARVIHVDRPGFGLSDFTPRKRLGDGATDIARIADHLHVDRFALVGVSGGGPYACACACELGKRVIRTALVSAVGPPGTMAFAKSPLVRMGFAAAASVPWLIALPIAIAARLAARTPGFYLDRLIASLPACDREVLSRPEIRAVLVQDVAEAFRNGHAGFLQDLRLEAGPWGLALDRVSGPVGLWHGALDETVPPIAMEALAAVLPHATVKLFPQTGHFFVFDIWGEILSWLTR